MINDLRTGCESTQRTVQASFFYAQPDAEEPVFQADGDNQNELDGDDEHVVPPGFVIVLDAHDVNKNKDEKERDDNQYVGEKAVLFDQRVFLAPVLYDEQRARNQKKRNDPGDHDPVIKSQNRVNRRNGKHRDREAERSKLRDEFGSARKKLRRMHGEHEKRIRQSDLTNKRRQAAEEKQGLFCTRCHGEYLRPKRHDRFIDDRREKASPSDKCSGTGPADRRPFRVGEQSQQAQCPHGEQGENHHGNLDLLSVMIKPLYRTCGE